MSLSANKKVVIADNQFLIVESLKLLIDSMDGFEVMAITNDLLELSTLFKASNVNLLITDFTLFNNGKNEQLFALKNEHPELNILLLSNHITAGNIHEFTHGGIKVIVSKNADRYELMTAINAAVKDKKYYSEAIIELLVSGAEKKDPLEPPTHLTPTEIEVVRYIANGLTTKEIANKKNLSFHTIITHRKNIFRKLKIKNASELLMHAIKIGIIDDIEYYI